MGWVELVVAIVGLIGSALGIWMFYVKKGSDKDAKNQVQATADEKDIRAATQAAASQNATIGQSIQKSRDAATQWNGSNEP